MELFNKDDIERLIVTLDLIEENSSRNQKEEYLKLLKDNETAKWFLYKALSPDITFGVIPDIDQYNCLENAYGETDFDYLNVILSSLENRVITGNKARETIQDFFKNYCNPIHYKWISRLFRKDLCCGIDIKTVNKVIKDLIPKFGVQLCEHIKIYRNSNDKLYLDKKINYPCFISPKLDGMRCILVKQGNDIKIYSRTGKVIENSQHIIDNLTNISDIVLDGELKGRTWNETISLAHSKESKSELPKMKFNVFDCIPICEWQTKQTKTPFEVRYEYLLNKEEIFNNEFVSLVEHEYIENENQLINKFQEYIDLGYEGIVIKYNNSYKFDRTNDWIAIKEFQSIDLPIIGYNLLNSDKDYIIYNKIKYKSNELIGSIVVDYNGKAVNIGSGFTMSERIDLFKNRNNLIGLIVEIEYKEVTKDKSLLNPTFMRIRYDK